MQLFLLLAAFIVYLIVGINLGFGMVGNILGLIAAVIIYKILANLYKSNRKILVPNGFIAKYSNENIALDLDNGQLWARDKTGKQKVFHKSEIVRWEYDSTHDARVNANFRSYITLHVKDLDKPIWHIQFNRHWPDSIIWQGRKNNAEAKEWYSRLTTWVNN
jgi:hypothetical protein